MSITKKVFDRKCKHQKWTLKKDIWSCFFLSKMHNASTTFIWGNDDIRMYFKKTVSLWRQHDDLDNTGFYLYEGNFVVYHISQYHWKPDTLFHGNSFLWWQWHLLAEQYILSRLYKNGFRNMNTSQCCPD